MTTAYPGGIDDFAEASPTYMSDPDSTGRTHDSRHDDVESAVEAVQRVLGVNPQGGAATVAARIAPFTATGLVVDGSDHYFRTQTGTPHTRLKSDFPTFYGREIPTAWQDDSVGRRIFIWDRGNARWQMVYGDTGWRNIGATLINGWSGLLLIRRYGATVDWRLFATGGGASATLAPMIPGFRPGPDSQWSTVFLARSNTDGSLASMFISSDNFTLYGNTTHLFQAGGSFTTADAWPDSLPGDASGLIPTAENLLPSDWSPDIDPAIPTGLSPDDDTSGWTVTYPEGPVTA